MCEFANGYRAAQNAHSQGIKPNSMFCPMNPFDLYQPCEAVQWEAWEDGFMAGYADLFLNEELDA